MLVGFGKAGVGVAFVILAAVVLGLIGLAHWLRSRY